MLEATAEPATEVRDWMSERMEEIWGLGLARAEVVTLRRKKVVGSVDRIAEGCVRVAW